MDLSKNENILPHKVTPRLCSEYLRMRICPDKVFIVKSSCFIHDLLERTWTKS